MMMKILKNTIMLIALFASVQLFGQSYQYIYVEGIAKTPFTILMDNISTFKSADNYIVISKVANGAHELKVMLPNNVEQNFAVDIINNQSVGFKIQQDANGELSLVQIPLKPNMQVASSSAINDAALQPNVQGGKKKKSFIDKLLGENVDGQDVKSHGLYKQGIKDEKFKDYQTLLAEQAAANAKSIPPQSVKNITPPSEVSTKAPATNSNATNNSTDKKKKKSGIVQFFTEDSYDNNEVKINHPKKDKKQKTNSSFTEEPLLGVVPTAVAPTLQEKIITEKADLNAIAANKLKQKQLEDEKFAEQQRVLLSMKAEKEKMDAIAREEQIKAEKEKFLEKQKQKMDAEAQILMQEKAEQQRIAKEKLANEMAAKKLIDDAEAAKKKKADEAIAKAKAADAAKKAEAEKLAKEKKIAAELAQKAEAERKIAFEKAEANRLAQEEIEAKEKIKKEKENAIAAAANLKKLEAEKLKQQKEYELKKKQQELAAASAKAALEKAEKTKAEALANEQKAKEIKQALAEKAEKIAKEKQDAIAKANAEKAEKVAKERQASIEKQERIAKLEAEKIAEQNKQKEEAIVRAKLLQEAKEIEAKKVLIAEQAKLEQEKLLALAATKNAELELAKKDAEVWKLKYEAEQKAKADAELKAKELAVANAKVEEQKLTKIEKKVNKVKNRPNPNCSSLHSEEELITIFQKLEAKQDDDARLNYCKKIIKDKKCFNCKDLEQLSQSFNTQSGKFDFVKYMFAYVQDNENYELLENVFKYESYKAKVRMEFGGETEQK
jgi:Domain of unknown function (DUF4476)